MLNVIKAVRMFERKLVFHLRRAEVLVELVALGAPEESGKALLSRKRVTSGRWQREEITEYIPYASKTVVSAGSFLNINDGELIYGVEYLVDSLTEQEAEAKDAEERRFEFSFPILTVRTQVFTGVFDRLGALRASRLASWAALVIEPVVAGIGLFLVCSSLFALLWNPAAGEAAREAGLGANLLLPGVNPFVPLLYGWFAIVCAIAIHEGAHGVTARSLGLKVKSSGLLFLLFFPSALLWMLMRSSLRRRLLGILLGLWLRGLAATLLWRRYALSAF